MTKVGGVAGSAVNGANLLNVENSGNVFGEKETGGIVGYAGTLQLAPRLAVMIPPLLPLTVVR